MRTEVPIELDTDIGRTSGQVISAQDAKELAQAVLNRTQSKDDVSQGLLERICNTAAHFSSDVSGLPRPESNTLPNKLQLHDILASILNEGSNVDEDQEAELRRNLHQYLHYARQNTTVAKVLVTDQNVVGVALSLLEPGDRVVFPVFDCKHNNRP